MKTPPIQPPQVSSYPIQAKAAARDKEQQSFPVPPDTKRPVSLPDAVLQAGPDAPENWDEAWFANYE